MLNSKIFRLTILLLVLIAIFIQHRLPDNKDEINITSIELNDLKVLFNDAASFKISTDPTISSQIYNNKGDLIGHFVFSSSEKFKGYGGKIPFIIAFDLNQKISAITILKNMESASFVKYLKKIKFFERWNGFSIDEIKKLKVDSISGATMTSSAVIAGVRERLSLLAKGPFPDDSTIFTTNNFIKFLEIIVTLFAILSLFYPEKFKQFRQWLLISSVVVLGFISGHFISLSLGFNWLINGIPFAAHPVLSSIVVTSLIINTVTNKAFYCHFLCPYGALQELAAKCFSNKIKIPKIAHKIFKYSRKFILFTIGGILIIGYNIDLSNIEPFAAFLLMMASKYAIALAIIFFLISFIYPKFWCRYFCPTGELLSIFSYRSRKKASIGTTPQEAQPAESPDDQLK